jgi:hypothetical protein
VPEFHYKPGVDNIVTNTLSQYPLLDQRKNQDEEKTDYMEYHHDASANYHDQFLPADADPSELKDALMD